MTAIVKALTVRQPWARRIVEDGKDVENRSRKTNHRGGLWIHAGLALEWLEVGPEDGPRASLTLGAIIGHVDVVGAHHSEDCGNRCSPWAQPDSWHWELANPDPLLEPVPCRGALGLWRVPDEVLAKLSVGAR